MKKELCVKPVLSAVILLVFSVILSCESEVQPAQGFTSIPLSEISERSRTIRFDQSSLPEMPFILDEIACSPGEEPPARDSLHFNEPSVPDSIRINRTFALGSGSALVFSVTVPAGAGSDIFAAASDAVDDAVLFSPEGLRSVYLSDRTSYDIDEERASSAVEPPPRVNHYLKISYTPDKPDSCMVIVDSMVVDFNESNMDSLSLRLSDSNSAVISVAGRFGRSGTDNRFICFADSSGIYSGVFINVLALNRLYLDGAGEPLGQARLTSAFLSGRGFYPLSSTPENYTVTFDLPDSITAWTPLQEDLLGVRRSDPGGIIGGLPVAVGSYTRRDLFDRYSLLTLDGGETDSIDARVVEWIAGAMVETLDFPSADFSFVEILNPDGHMVIPGFASLMFSRGSLEALADLSLWEENLSSGELPAGCSIITGAAEGILMQSLQLDPVLFDMLRAWFPIRYYDFVQEGQIVPPSLMEAYMKYYLFNTELMSFGGANTVLMEYSLADLKLTDSPLMPYVAGGKGVLILEYLYSMRMLNRLPFLLQNFTHASSGNYWLKIYSSLRIERGSAQYELLRKLFYLPGIPQLRVTWREENGLILMDPVEIQPGTPFELPLETCVIHLSDTSFTREVTVSPSTGLLQCGAGPSGQGQVEAIDLNPAGVIPMDIMYRREGME